MNGARRDMRQCNERPMLERTAFIRQIYGQLHDPYLGGNLGVSNIDQCSSSQLCKG